MRSTLLFAAVLASTAAGAEMSSAKLPACIHGTTIALDPAAKPPLHLGTQSYPRTLALCDHEVVLTFDDGPSPHTTPRICARSPTPASTRPSS